MSSFTIPDEDRQPTDWKAIEAALHDYVVGVLDIPFIWDNQNLPQPLYPYASGLVTSIVPSATTLERRHKFNAAGLAGKELDVKYVANIGFTFTVQVHVDPVSGAYDPLSDAKMMATRLQASLCKNEFRGLLAAAKIAVVENLAVIDSSVVVNGEWLSRYTWDIRLRTTAVVSDTDTYIDKTEVSGTFPGHPQMDFTEVYDSTV